MPPKKISIADDVDLPAGSRWTRSKLSNVTITDPPGGFQFHFTWANSIPRGQVAQAKQSDQDEARACVERISPGTAADVSEATTEGLEKRSALRQELIKACRMACLNCVRECESALARDPLYTQPGTRPYSENHLALVACASVCQLTASALAELTPETVELVAWCSEICCSCAGMQQADAQLSTRNVCAQCAKTCMELAREEHLRHLKISRRAVASNDTWTERPRLA